MTLVRASLVALLAGLLPELPSERLAFAAVAVAVLAALLDAVDGALARRRGLASAFGARFDMETDALLIMVLASLAAAWGRVGIWVLLSGLMRYLYVGAGLLLPWLRASLPQSRMRQTICVVQVVALIVVLAPFVPPALAAAVAAVALVLLSGSFLADIVRLAGPRARQIGARCVAAATLAAALFTLNAALSFHNAWPTPAITLRAEIAVEAALLVLGLALLHRWRGAVSPQARWTLAALLLLWSLARYAEVTAPALYGRPVNLYWDARHLGAVVAMLARVVAGWQLLLGTAVLALLLLAATALFQACVGRIAAALAPGTAPGVRRGLPAVASLVVALFIADRGFGVALGPLHFSNPVAQTWGEQFARFGTSWRAARQAQPFAVPPLAATSLRGAGGADVFVVFVESYGAVALERPALAARIAAGRRRLAAAIAATGRDVVSARVDSPTFGGGSWLAAREA